MKEIFYRANQYLLFTILAAIILYFGKTLLIPIIFGALLAMLFAPLCRRLDQWGWPRALSTLSCVLILVFILAGIGAIISAQFATFSKDIDKIEFKAKELVYKGQMMIQKQFGISPEKQKSMVKEQTKEMEDKAGGLATNVVKSVTSSIAGIVLTLVITFLFLFNKEKYETFFLKLFKEKDPEDVQVVVHKISHVSQQYLTGRAMSITIIAILYAIGLSIVGIKNAILLACIAALLTLVPYIGTVVGGIFPVFMALVTEDSLQPALWCIVVLFAIQTIDNYFIEPNVVGGEVNLNALFSIISIIAGGLIWGIPGMILFLPLTGIVKIICDHVDALNAFGFMLGDTKGKKQSKLSSWIKAKVRGSQ